jgi:hypothetical protein
MEQRDRILNKQCCQKRCEKLERRKGLLTGEGANKQRQNQEKIKLNLVKYKILTILF